MDHRNLMTLSPLILCINLKAHSYHLLQASWARQIVKSLLVKTLIFKIIYVEVFKGRKVLFDGKPNIQKSHDTIPLILYIY